VGVYAISVTRRSAQIKKRKYSVENKRRKQRKKNG